MRKTKTKTFRNLNLIVAKVLPYGVSFSKNRNIKGNLTTLRGNRAWIYRRIVKFLILRPQKCLVGVVITKISNLIKDRKQ